jgi:hypothetical protein
VNFAAQKGSPRGAPGKVPSDPRRGPQGEEQLGGY